LSLIIALDIGGTFTDLVAFDLASGAVHQAKSSTTPYDLAVGIAETLGKSGLAIAGADTFIHGSTVAINTAIERTGAPTALLTTQGMRDVYQIGRGNRPEAYNFHFKRPEPYVPRHLTFELKERLNAAGDVIVPLDATNARAVAERLRELKVEAVAVCLIHAWANPAHEQVAGEQLAQAAPELYRSLSHEILREYREYERTSTTVLNAYVGPRVSRYLDDLERLLAAGGFRGQFLIMQSNGGSMSPATAKKIPVATMESGPVGGIIAAAECTRDLGYRNAIAFDMGGTTAKVSLVQDNEPDIAPGLFHWRRRARSSRDVSGCRHRRGRRRRRQHCLDRRRWRAQSRDHAAPAAIRARCATARAARNRPSPTPTWRWAVWAQAVFSAVKCHLMSRPRGRRSAGALRNRST
jgi:N-methylhydantoinase A